MTHQQKLEAIREACITVNPSRQDIEYGKNWDDGSVTESETPVQLADVCLLIEHKAKNIGWIELLKRFTAFTAVIGNEGHLYYYLIGTWNLLKPLHEQDEATINFLYELII